MMIVDGINYYYRVCQIVIFEFHHSFDVIISCFFFFFFYCKGDLPPLTCLFTHTSSWILDELVFII